MKILVVEDQKDLVKNMKQYLELEGFKVEVAHDGEEAQEMVEHEKHFEAIILDLNLPKKDGMTLARDWRNNGVKTPIVILTARTAKDSVIAGLNLGADDYITKPFDMDELVARVRSVIRRSHSQANPQIEVGDFKIDMNAKQVFKNGEAVKLAPKEYALFEHLALHKGQVQERDVIIEQVWGEFDNLMFSQTVDVHIAYLRKKLGKDIIKTAPGGYMIENNYV